MPATPADREILVITDGFAMKMQGNEWDEIFSDEGDMCVTVRRGDRQKVASFSRVSVIAFDDEVKALTVNQEEEETP